MVAGALSCVGVWPVWGCDVRKVALQTFSVRKPSSIFRGTQPSMIAEMTRIWTPRPRILVIATIMDDPRACTTTAGAVVTTMPRRVASVDAVCVQDVEIDGRPVSVWGIDALLGSDNLEIVSGRAPSEPDEVALGAVTLRNAHKHMGDTVSVHGDRVTTSGIRAA